MGSNRLHQEPRPAFERRTSLRKFLAAILAHKAVAPLLSDEHFSVDGTLIEAWASMKSFQPKAGRTAASRLRARRVQAKRLRNARGG